MIKIPDPMRVHTKDLGKADFNWLFFFNMFLAVILSIYLAWKDVKAGYIYIIMFFGITALITLMFLFIRDDRTLRPISDYIRIPIATKMTLAGWFYVVGFFLPLFIQAFIRWLGSGYNITNLSIPLFSVSINNAFQTFSTAEVGNSMAWRIFVTMFDAGNIETFVYNFGLPMIGVIVALFTFGLASSNGKTLWGMSKRFFVVGFGVFVIPVALFVLSHLMNENYTLGAFILAGIFLAISNASIYLFGVFLLFWAGYHQGNNLLALILQEGFSKVMEGFVSWFGAIFIIYMGLIIFYLIRNSTEVGKDLRWWRNS